MFLFLLKRIFAVLFIAQKFQRKLLSIDQLGLIGAFLYVDVDYFLAERVS